VGDVKTVLRELNAMLKATPNGHSIEQRKPWWNEVNAWRTKHPMTYTQPRDAKIKPQYVIDRLYQLRDVYFPYVGMEDHTEGHPCRFGVWADGTFRWISDGDWERKIRYAHETLVGDVHCSNAALGLRPPHLIHGHRRRPGSGPARPQRGGRDHRFSCHHRLGHGHRFPLRRPGALLRAGKYRRLGNGGSEPRRGDGCVALQRGMARSLSETGDRGLQAQRACLRGSCKITTLGRRNPRKPGARRRIPDWLLEEDHSTQPTSPAGSSRAGDCNEPLAMLVKDGYRRPSRHRLRLLFMDAARCGCLSHLWQYAGNDLAA